MDLGDYLKKTEPIPDDIQDMREFSYAISMAIPCNQSQKLIQDFLLLSMRLTHLVDELKIYESDEIKQAFSLSCIFQVYKFLKSNQQAVRKLMSLDGDPFLNDSHND